MIRPTDPNIKIDSLDYPRKSYVRGWVVNGIIINKNNELELEPFEFSDQENAHRFYNQYKTDE